MGNVISPEFNNDDEFANRFEIIMFRCPHCTDCDGSFGQIQLYIPRENNPIGIASQANCNGQEDCCVIVNSICQTFNGERYLRSLARQHE